MNPWLMDCLVSWKETFQMKSKKDRAKIRRANELHPGKYFSDDELDALKEHLEKCEEWHPRDCLMIELLMYTGARPQEILDLRAMDLDKNGMLYLTAIKDSNSRWIPLPEKTASKLRRHMIGLSPADHMFRMTYTRFYQISKPYMPPGKTLRSLRHTYAMKLYNKTRDVRLVQQMLGHRLVSTTEIYLDYTYSHEELRERIYG